ncbi:hypothetical protein GPL17_19145 [Bradyrhizobium yuanmingense]|uniref:protein-glutamine glutaminase family protein n=1 Tax=Bradyrhizobium yuanmingense TaxID=108015 RepID=UPI0012F8DDAF|nr:protein-glutamine glutaminase family protein [Bradyrhizobium yuanmingense]MVT52601.1 hypothetical protein [Bradyrhizobium yuanmingense]
MAAQRTMFGLVNSLETAPKTLDAGGARSATTVRLEGGGTAHLSDGHPRAELYRSLLSDARDGQVPIHLTVDDTTGTVETLRIPLPKDSVASVTELDADTMEVELHLSPARHVLKRSNPDFERLRGDLQRAAKSGTGVILTETEDHEVIDVRETASPFELEKSIEEAPAPRAAAAAISLQDAEKLFATLNGKSCNPKTPQDPCITFLYPDDGCYARAHEMCRLIGTAQSGKVWNYGKLTAKTLNHPNCKVEWKYHVATTVPVKIGGTTASYVLDPSLFSKPVTIATWTGVQGDSGSTTVETGAEPLYRAPDGKITKDDDYSQTKSALVTFRMKLKDRSSSTDGAPPYEKCKALLVDAEVS